MYVYISFKYKLLQLLSQLKDCTLFYVKTPLVLADLETHIFFDPRFDSILEYID